MNYNLNPSNGPEKQPRVKPVAALKKLLALVAEENRNLLSAFIAILINAGLNLTGPLLVGYTIDHYIETKQYHGVIVFSLILFGMYMAALCTSYLQTKWMGGVGQRTLFKLRNTIFNKLQELPIAFFNQNKAGDLISRINNDTDKLNQFFSQSLMQFIGSIFIMTGAGVFLLCINFRLGAAALVPALLLLVFTRFISPWVRRKNAQNLKSTGGLSAEVQESLNNFKVIIAFNRRDYFRKRFDEANRHNYTTAIGAGLANNVFMPIYGFCSNIAQLIVLTVGIYLIAAGHFTIGLLISYLAYINNFYSPLRQLAALWANFQVALAGWDRISQILSLESDLVVIPATSPGLSPPLMEFRDVNFHYPGGKEVLHNISFQLERGKTYAFVGPTGGGKTTTASLMSRLYDPNQGMILLDGKDIRSYDTEKLSGKIGFILQDPLLFSGTVKDNIVYGNKQYEHYSTERLGEILEQTSLKTLLPRFESGLETTVQSNGDLISLGQKQLIAFMRAVLRGPALLILDEASANIDTVTERLLSDILKMLPASTTLVIIAHRLNTIENADEIFFVNTGNVTPAGSLDHAMNMLLQDKRKS